ncbi:TPA: type 4b pilus protein PilO2 [Enterobacter asburiae]
MNVQTDTSSAEEQLGEQLQGVVAIGRRRYAVSLIWNQSESSKPLAAEAKEAAERMGCSLFAIRPGKGRWNDQFAIADVNLGHKAGLPSLAVALAEELNVSLLAVWQLSEQVWWLVGINQDGSILYDRAVADAHDIQQDFLEALTTVEWEKIFCPSEWEIPKTEPPPPLNGNISKGKVRIRPVKVNKLRIVLIATSVAVIIGGGLFAYEQYQDHLLELKMIEESKKKRTGFALDNDIEVPPMPWAGKPLFNLALVQCIRDLAKYAEEASQIPAWEREEGTCDGSVIDYRLKSTGGTEVWLNIMAERLPSKPTSASANGTEGNISWKLPELPTYPPNSPGVPLRKTQEYLTVELAELFIPITFSQPVNELFWLKMEYSLNNIQELPSLVTIFSKIPASIIKSVSYNPTSKRWSLEAEVYERRKPTPQEIEALRNKK